MVAHYDEHKERPFFPKLVKYVSSSPIYAMVIEAPEGMSEEEAVGIIRSMAGPTMKIREEYKSQRSELEEKLPTMTLEEVEKYYILPPKGTIRFDIPVKFGYKFDITKNVVHSSDSAKSGAREIAIFEKALERQLSNSSNL